jgi:heptosyltransferase II
MKDVTDRKYFQFIDKSVSITNLVSKSKPLYELASRIVGVVLYLMRKVYPKQREGNISVLAFLRLGDTVFSIPAVKMIRHLYPLKKVYVLCYPESLKIYRIHFPDYFEFIPILKNEFIWGRRIAKRSVRRKLLDTNPGKVFDLTGSIQSASVLFNCKAKEIYGYNLPVFKNIYSSFRLKRNSPHLMEMYMDSVKLASELQDLPATYEFQTKFEPSGYILIHPLAIRKSKEWNFNKYISLYTELNKKYETYFLLPSSSIEQDIVADLYGKGINIKFSKDIDDLIEIINGCALYVSNDTGPLYIANLLGKPTFTIYGPTNPAYSFPFGKNHQFINKIIGCSPITEQTCFTLAGIKCTHYDCMNLLNFDKVYSFLLEFINELGIKNQKELATNNSSR